jgi:hypothetical protein
MGEVSPEPAVPARSVAKVKVGLAAIAVSSWPATVVFVAATARSGRTRAAAPVRARRARRVLLPMPGAVVCMTAPVGDGFARVPDARLILHQLPHPVDTLAVTLG